MELYLRKSGLVEAEQWFPEKPVEAQSQIFLSDHWWLIQDSGVAIPLYPGDWIIRDADGGIEYSLCPDALFRTLYQPVSEDDRVDVGWDETFFIW